MTGPPEFSAISPWVVERSGSRLMSIPLAGIGRDEAVDGQLAVLESVHQLVREGGALLIGGEPVAHHHDLADGIVVGRDLLLEEIKEETLEIVVGRQYAPRHHALALALELVLGVAPLDLLLDEAPVVRARAHEDGRRCSGGGDASDRGELIVERGGHRLERGLLHLDRGLPAEEERRGEGGEDEEQPEQAGTSHGPIVTQGLADPLVRPPPQRRAVSAIPATTRRVESASSGESPSRLTAAATSTPQIGVVSAMVARPLGR